MNRLGKQLRIDREFERVQDALHNAPFTHNGWLLALELLSDACGARGANLVCLGGEVPSLNLIAGFDQQEVDSAFNDPRLWGAQNWRVRVTNEAGEFQHDGHYDDYRSVVRCSDYDEACDALDMPFGCQTVFMKDVGGFIGLALMRGRRDGPCDERAFQRFQHLCQVTERALRLQLAIDSEAARLMLEGRGAGDDATILLDRHGMICAQSEATETLKRDGILRDHGDAMLSLGDHESQTRLDRLLTSMITNDPDDLVRELQIECEALGHPGALRLIATRLPARDLGLGFQPHVAVTFHRTRRASAAIRSG